MTIAHRHRGALARLVALLSILFAMVVWIWYLGSMDRVAKDCNEMCAPNPGALRSGTECFCERGLVKPESVELESAVNVLDRAQKSRDPTGYSLEN